jgi:outer membrane murein-binding lipoprotein Lpp
LSPLTKAFVVLVTVLSVLLVALIVPYVAQTEDYAGQIRDLEAKASQAELSARVAEQEKSAIQADVSKDSALLNQRVTALTTEMNQLREQAAAAKSDVLQGNRELAQLKAELTRLSSAAVQDADLLTITTTDLKGTRQSLVDSQTKLVQLGDRNNELESQRDSLNRQVNRIGEQMVSLEQDNVSLRGLLARVPEQYRQEVSTGQGEKPQFEASSPIAGTITDVQIAAGTQLVQVDVGSKDGVEENMKFLVHRDDHYVGTFVVDRVESAIAAGRMVLTRGNVQTGDQIYTGPY